jgi:hypothetical protein
MFVHRVANAVRWPVARQTLPYPTNSNWQPRRPLPRPGRSFIGSFEGRWRLNAQGRRAALNAFERRLAQGPGAPGGGARRHAYRDAMTTQARDLARALRESEAFVAFGPRR